ncbi:signal peptidase I [Gracilibacillus ureilyticus]|uniref:Signal peptidase I n=1 Tax=Gracilibacillus ureilyticus TaxID=531814 RepID=A0A1H9L377_9BACI|nr:signal peptidase I [Gracilibacillus ureilyticus]SER05904.1 signal peptidase I [Gracilibacillus ureilyticus]
MATKRSDWIDWIKTIIITVIVIVLIRMFIAVPIVVEGPSMLPTLEDNDRLIVDKISLVFQDPQRFDVVVFHATEKKDFIKRVIGLPGETIEYRDDQLFVNGEYVEEPYLQEVKRNLDPEATYTVDFTLEDIPGGTMTVPDGHVFVLGDNRKNSTDSRHLGFIPLEQVTGISRLSYWPVKNIGIVE